MATETDNGARLDEPRVKALTGGDVVSARRMRENFWTFKPSHKLVLCSNYRPKVRGTDHGIWRRILLFPFTQTFDGSRKDKELHAKLLAEASGILAWAVRGCIEWQRIGLNPPEEVQAATRAYRSAEDVIGRFVADCCVTGSQALLVKFSQFYAALESWCHDVGESLPGRKTAGQWLQDQGFEAFHSGGSKYRGIGIGAEQPKD